MLKCNFRILMAGQRINSIVAFQELSGVSRNSLNKLWHEQDIASLKLDTLLRVCDALHCELDELIQYRPDY